MKSSVVLWAVLSFNLRCSAASESENLLQLSCFDGSQCRQFDRPEVTADCVGGSCQCSSSGSGAVLQCKPRGFIFNNIIGGPCPCYQPHSECNVLQDICYCAPDYVPTKDRRRCMPKSVPVEAECESDSQCALYDAFAECAAGRCRCKKDFALAGGACASIVGKNASCGTDSECVAFGGVTARCNLPLRTCLCPEGRVAATTAADCLSTLDYGANCTQDTQCQGSLGPGGFCGAEGTCDCDQDHYAAHRKDARADVNATYCVRSAVLAEYCRNNEDCHTRVSPGAEQTMTCLKGECNCRYGFYSINMGPCTRGNRGHHNKADAFVLAIATLGLLRTIL